MKYLSWSHIRAYALWGALFFAIGFAEAYYGPQLNLWVQREIIRLSAAHLPVAIWPQSASVGLLPPRLELSDIRILPKDPLASQISPASIASVEVRLNWIKLFMGRLILEELRLTYPQVTWIDKREKIPESDEPLELPELEPLFALLSKVPVEKVVLERLSLLASSHPLGVSAKIDDALIMIENHFNSLFLELQIPQVLVKERSSNRHLDIQVDTRALIEPTSFKLSRLKVKLGESFILASGSAQGHLEKKTPEEANLLSRVQADLEDLRHWLGVLLPKTKIPTLSGILRTDLHWQKEINSLPELSFSVSGQDLRVEGLLIGDVRASGEWSQDQLKLNQATVSSSAGEIVISDGLINISQLEKFKANVAVNHLELSQLLENIKIPNVPLQLDLQGKLPCEGTIKPSFALACRGEVVAKYLEVWAADRKKTIVQLRNAKSTGFVNVTTKDVSYEADIELPKGSKGKSKGRIDFEQGFQIGFEGEAVNLEDLQDLVSLRAKGIAKIGGTTEGTSKWAKLNLNLDADELSLRGYKLGKTHADLGYGKSILSFTNISGRIGNSLYAGDLELNFAKDMIKIEAKSAYLEWPDVLAVIENNFPIPVGFRGTGSAELKAWGPLDIPRLNYQLRSAFYRGDIAKESFDQMYIDLTSVNGVIKADRIQLLKAQSTVDVTGQLDYKDGLDVRVHGQSLRLEESENTTSLGFDLSGRADLDLKIQGPINDPQFSLDGTVTKMVVGDTPAEDSTINLNWDKTKMAGRGQLLGDRLKTDFSWPFREGYPIRLDVESTKWDFAKALSIVSSTARQRQFDSSLTLKMNLIANDGTARTLNGTFNVENLELKRGPLRLSAKSSTTLNLSSGVLRGPPLLLEGSAGTLKLSADQSSFNSLNAELTGKIDLALMAIFTPFLSDLQGKLNLNTRFADSVGRPQITGSAYIESGFLKFQGFPQAFDEVSADLLFSQQDIVINTLKSNIGGGSLTGDGRVRIEGNGVLPVEVRGQFQNVSLNFPENVRSKGSGVWQIRGSQRPYLLSIEYGIQAGEITAELGGSGIDTQKSTINAAYLPKFVAAASTEPIEFDIQTRIENPLIIRNSLLDTSLRGQLRVQGPASRLLYTGIITPSAGGKLFFRDVPFDISTGYVEYQGGTIDSAKVYATAQAQVVETIRDENDREVQKKYQINLIVQGRASDPKIVLSSLPPLEQKEIASLLALGMTPASLQSNRTSGQLATTNSMQLGTSILQKPLSKEVKKRLGFDVQVGQAPSSATNQDTLQVKISKQFSPSFNASASRTLEANPRSAARAEVRVNKNFSLIGSYTTQEGALEINKDVNRSIFGMDLEYKVKFK